MHCRPRQAAIDNLLSWLTFPDRRRIMEIAGVLHPTSRVIVNDPG